MKRGEAGLPASVRSPVSSPSTSNRPAAPIPPPIHMVTTTCLAPRRLPRCDRYDLRLEPPRGLSCGRALLGLECERVLPIPGDAITLGNDLCGIDHRHAGIVMQSEEFVIGTDAQGVGLYQRDRLHSACQNSIDLVDDDLLRCCRDAHEPGRALAVDHHA